MAFGGDSYARLAQQRAEVLRGLLRRDGVAPAAPPAGAPAAPAALAPPPFAYCCPYPSPYRTHSPSAAPAALAV
jgi:hypothetical protein